MEKKRRRYEPIAIVGSAFRFPGDLADEESYWNVLANGQDVVTSIGPERWATDHLYHPKRSEPGRSITFSAGVLSRIDQFDAAFFGISPREAAWLDPQQRLLLELAWEAMENGGIVPASLGGTHCSVFVGISGIDYGVRALDDLSAMSAHSMTGNTLSMAANRLSYVFDLRGPSMAIDTACSSSLVALHQACASLQRGDSDTALVGGVNLLLHPYSFVGFTKASMLSASGRCRAFDATGDGYVRSEGGAMLLLKLLAQAEADGDVIEAVIVGSGVNADGGRKTGITMPSYDGQSDLMREVMGRAGVDADQVVYVEAHGTGTAVGDPAEARAIGMVYGQPRTFPLPIGSVKTNLGHLEPASGMAGLMKALLILKREQIPPSLHLERRNESIDFVGLNLDLPTKLTPMQRPGRKTPVVGVNSFGFGGANAHLLLSPGRSDCAARGDYPAAVPPLFLSARTSDALRALAERYASELDGCDSSTYYELAHSAAFHRQHLEKRLAVFGTDVSEITLRLVQFSQRENAYGVVAEELSTESGTIAFIYSGNGSQWVGMGQKLLAESDRFRSIVIDLDGLIQPLAGFSIVEEIMACEGLSRMDDTSVAQPLLFSIQVAVTMLLRERGIEAAAVTGHSVGEVAAAWAVGALSLEQAVSVICERSAAQALTRGMGRMAAVGMSADEMLRIIDDLNLTTVELAGVNSPHSVTLAGQLAELEVLQNAVIERQTPFRLLDLDYAFHSRAMDCIAERLSLSLGALSPSRGGCMISTVTGKEIEHSSPAGDYWVRNVRDPVRFSSAIRRLIDMGCRTFVEIGPHAILGRYVTECLVDAAVQGNVIPTLRRNDDGLMRVEAVALQIHLAQRQPRLRTYFEQSAPYRRLPNYPWQREGHWQPRTSEGYGLLDYRREHLLLGWRLKECEATWENALDPQLFPFLADHRVADAVVLPAAAYVEMALAAARQWFGGETFEFENLDILAPVVFDGEYARSTRFELSVRDGGFRILSRRRLTDEEWTVNVVGRLLALSAEDDKQKVTADAVGDAVDVQSHYRLARQVGLDYGPAFRGFAGGHLANASLAADLDLPAPDSAGNGADTFLLHPVLLDSCFQSLVHFFRSEIEAGHGKPLLPVRIGRLRRYSDVRPVRFSVRLLRRGMRSVEADIDLYGPDGTLVTRLAGCRFRSATIAFRKGIETGRWETVPCLLDPLQRPTTVGVESNVKLARRVEEFLAEAELQRREKYFHDAVPLHNALVVSFTYHAFQDLNRAFPEWLDRSLNHPESLAEDRRALFVSLARALQESDLLLHVDGTWHLASDAPPSPLDIWRTLLADFPDDLAELLPIGRIGLHLSHILHDEAPASVLASVSRSIFLETLKEEGPAYRYMNSAVRELIRTLLGGWPTNRRLRVLEIGVSSGDSLFPSDIDVTPDFIDWVIASDVGDEGRSTLSNAQLHPSAILAALEPGQMSLLADSELPKKFDVVLVRHWVHRSENLARTLADLRGKLAANGRLILMERAPNLVADFVCGIDPRWWHSSDERPMSSLLPSFTWKTLLEEQGFIDIQTAIDPAVEEAGAEGFILFAANPGNEEVAPEAKTANWLVVCDASSDPKDISNRLVIHLESRGQIVRRASVGKGPNEFHPEDENSVARILLAAQAQMGHVDHIVHLAGIADEMEVAQPDIGAIENVRCIGALHILKAIGVLGPVTPPKLWLVTSGGALVSQPGEGWRVNPLQAPLWGFGRVVMNELPSIGCTLIDVAIDPQSPQAAERLHLELLFPDGENEVVLARDARYGLRFQAVPAHTETFREGEDRVRLDFETPGQLRNLIWLPDSEKSLQCDEVEVVPAAAGLNFRDVMYAMGLLPDEAVEKGYAGTCLGLEFAGTVARVGVNVKDYKVGDEVLGFGRACFASHVITKASAITKKPRDWSWAEAVTIPTAFFTAYYALKHLANVQPGERVLIHGAAGGVGIAAVQVAHCLGAETYATAGSEEKRDFVHLLGADHVFDSRSLAFADQILGQTGGEGVDVVLNSLAGEAINRNLRVLKPFGRFLELGKRDFFENTQIGLRPFKDNISYFGIDADQLLVERAPLAKQLLREVMDLFADRVLSPLPHKVFPAARMVDAFRYMQKSRHIGKIVLDLRNARMPIWRVAEPAVEARFDEAATYVVTGGLQGFGLEAACWLAESGAGHLALLSRRGMDTPGAGDAVARIEALGARVHVFACDVCDREALAAVLGKIESRMPPVRGVFHAAMALDDGLISNLDSDRFLAVLKPKLQGAWNLHQSTFAKPLHCFVLFSSVTTSIGNPGQANYVAANAYLEGLATWRRQHGMPATCVGWGPIGNAGYLARNTAVRDGLSSRLGAAPLDARQALASLGRLLAENRTNTAVADLDWSVLSRVLPSAKTARFERLARGVVDGGDTGIVLDIRSLIDGKPDTEVFEIVRNLVTVEVAQVLCVAPERIDHGKSLHDMGMDSLMMVETAIGIEKRFGVEVPVMLLSEGTSVEKVSYRLVDLLRTGAGKGQDEALTHLVSTMAIQHAAEYSADQIEQTVLDVRHAARSGGRIMQ